MEKSIKRRIDYIDILKGIAMILVIAGHLAYINPGTRKYIYSFHMPLFFVCYGLTYKTRKYDWLTIKKLFSQKFQRLYIPFIFWTLFFSAPTLPNILNILYGSHKALTFSTNSHLWFLPCFLVSTLLFELLNAIFYRIKLSAKLKDLLLVLAFPISVALSVSLPVHSIYNYPLSFNVALMGFAFIILGYFIKRIIVYFRIRHLNLGILIIIFLILIASTYTYRFNKVYHVSMADNFYGNTFSFLITASSASFAMIILSIILDRILFKHLKKLLIFVGQNTLGMIAIHHTIILELEKLAPAYYDFFPIPLPLVNTIIIILTLLLGCIIVKFINHFIPELNGRKAIVNNS